MTDDEPDSSADAEDVATALAMLDPDVWHIWSAPGVITIVRRWTDESADTVVLLSANTAYGRRDNAAGRLVWSRRGTATDVVRAVLDLPAPGHPDAPGTSTTEPIR